MSDVGSRIREFVIRATRLRSLEEEEDIFSTGIVNSLLLAQLLNLVEHEFGVPIDDDDLILDNFRSVGAITRLVERKRAESVAR
jgi:methoxymalonate biosynthesis acyl carrier protein